MNASEQKLTRFKAARLVPELLVTDIHKSLHFWCELCGFSVAYDRMEECFSYLERDGAQVMLDQYNQGRNWITGPLELPYGRGINLQIEVEETAPILEALARAKWPLFMEEEEKWYRKGEMETGVHQFIVQDPDGYLVRFSAHIGLRKAA